ncbi:MAG TPA: hypothetical protein V6C96_02330 [Vampirovibrionales bacterium]
MFLFSGLLGCAPKPKTETNSSAVAQKAYREYLQSVWFSLTPSQRNVLQKCANASENGLNWEEINEKQESIDRVIELRLVSQTPEGNYIFTKMGADIVEWSPSFKLETDKEALQTD